MHALAKAFGVRLQEVPVPAEAIRFMEDVLRNTDNGPLLLPEEEAIDGARRPPTSPFPFGTEVIQFASDAVWTLEQRHFNVLYWQAADAVKADEHEVVCVQCCV